MNTHAAIPLPHRSSAGWRIYAAIIAWLAALVVGWWFIEDYSLSTNESPTHSVVDHWPARTALTRRDNRPTMLLFLHPKCPCSRATLHELERLLTSIGEQASRTLDLIVVATVPETLDDSWLNTDTVEQAKRLVNARLFIDRGGNEAARFGAATSGLVMFFNVAGSRQYAGGVTVARGHEGASVGGVYLTEILRGESAIAREMPVFGCRLCLPEQGRGREIANQARQVGPRTRT